jgi:hypothetical protein
MHGWHQQALWYFIHVSRVPHCCSTITFVKTLGNLGQVLIIQLPFSSVKPRIDRCASIHVVFITLWPNIRNKFIYDDELFL